MPGRLDIVLQPSMDLRRKSGRDKGRRDHTSLALERGRSKVSSSRPPGPIPSRALQTLRCMVQDCGFVVIPTSSVPLPMCAQSLEGRRVTPQLPRMLIWMYWGTKGGVCMRCRHKDELPLPPAPTPSPPPGTYPARRSPCRFGQIIERKRLDLVPEGCRSHGSWPRGILGLKKHTSHPHIRFGNLLSPPLPHRYR